MDSILIASFISVGSLIIVQIGVFLYGYGKLSQKVDDLCKRVDKVDQRLNHLGDRVEKLAIEVSTLKGGV